MITRPNALIQAACISLLLMLVPGTAASQEQKEPAPQQVEKPAAERTPQQPGSLIVPGEKPAEEPTAAPAAVEPLAPAKDEPAEYTIKQGDTLWDISNTLLKDPFLWPFIWKANPYVTNPDLIYTGNKLTIPSLTPLEMAMEAAPKEQVVEKQAPLPGKEAAKTEETAALATKPEPSEEAVPAEGARLILPEEQPQLVIDKYAMLSAGFVNDVENGDLIVGPQEKGKTTLGYDDIVFVKVGSQENVNIGDKFLIYTPLGMVRHPRTGERAGRLIRGLGILQITAKDPSADVLTARITLSFDSVGTGSLLTPYQEPVLIYQSNEKRAKDISGYILEVTDRRSISGQTDYVYLDKGSMDGVDPGDRFTVYAEPEKRGYPRKVIGEVQVFLVKERTSTAVVRKNTDTLAKGDAVDFKK